MSKRLQVVVRDSEFERYMRSAQAEGLTLSEWIRHVLRQAERDISHGDADAKLAAVRTAARHSFPTADIDTMLAEIEQSYSASAGQ